MRKKIIVKVDFCKTFGISKIINLSLPHLFPVNSSGWMVNALGYHFEAQKVTFSLNIDATFAK
jgi:hypothetical protein